MQRTKKLVKQYDVETHVYIKQTELLSIVDDKFETAAETIVISSVKNNIRKIVILTNKELTEEEVDLRIKTFLMQRNKIACTKCGYRYDNTRYVSITATRNGTYYHNMVCERCNPNILYVSSIFK